MPSRRVALIGAKEGPPVCIADILKPFLHVCGMKAGGLIVLMVYNGQWARYMYDRNGRFGMPKGEFAVVRYEGPKPGPICEVRAA